MTLDDGVTKLLTAVMSDMYEEVGDPDNWTAETRDEMAEKLRTLRDGSVQLSITYLDMMKTSEVKGRSALEWYMDFHATQSILAVFMLIRENMDKLNDDEISSDSKFTYEWIQNQIRREQQRLIEIDMVIKTIDPFKPKTEDL